MMDRTETEAGTGARTMKRLRQGREGQGATEMRVQAGDEPEADLGVLLGTSDDDFSRGASRG